MKTSKLLAQRSNQNKEDCDVWLDTVQLKGRAKKMRSARPISKLLNPLSDGAGYNVAVALNFTQTKMEMPKTKQSTISNFFSGHRRVLNKMSTTGRPNNVATAACSSSALPAIITTKSSTEDLSDFVDEPLWCDVDFKQGNNQLDEPLMWWEKGNESNESFENLDNNSSVDTDVLLKRQPFKDVLPSNNCERNGLMTQRFENAYEDSETVFLGSLPSQNEFNALGGSLFDTDVKTSTQTCKRISLHNDKENTYPDSPKKTMLDSQMQRMPNNTTLEPLNSLNEGANSPFKWTEPKNSPVKKHKLQLFKDSEVESLSTLFTQDSQGFRVIAHRDFQTRSPLKDQSKVSLSVLYESPRLEEDEDEEEMLFTQDSQGNMVIKH